MDMKKYKVKYLDGEFTDSMFVFVDGTLLSANVRHEDYPWEGGDVPDGWYDNLGAYLDLIEMMKAQAVQKGIDPNVLVFGV